MTVSDQSTQNSTVAFKPTPRPRPQNEPQPPMPNSWPGVALVGLAMLGLMALSAKPAAAQDFSCTGSLLAAERTICQHPRLRHLDDRMAELYGRLWGRLGEHRREALRDHQRSFLETRNQCGNNQACIRNAYFDRNAVLQHRLDRVAEK